MFQEMYRACANPQDVWEQHQVKENSHARLLGRKRRELVKLGALATEAAPRLFLVCRKELVDLRHSIKE